MNIYALWVRNICEVLAGMREKVDDGAANKLCGFALDNRGKVE